MIMLQWLFFFQWTTSFGIIFMLKWTRIYPLGNHKSPSLSFLAKIVIINQYKCIKALLDQLYWWCYIIPCHFLYVPSFLPLNDAHTCTLTSILLPSLSSSYYMYSSLLPNYRVLIFRWYYSLRDRVPQDYWACPSLQWPWYGYPEDLTDATLSSIEDSNMRKTKLHVTATHYTPGKFYMYMHVHVACMHVI